MIPYVLHVALLISVCLLFYKLLLQRETFYRLNRIVLVCCLALSFALPLIPIPQQWAMRSSSQAMPTNVESVEQVQIDAQTQTSVVQDVQSEKITVNPNAKVIPSIKVNPAQQPIAKTAATTAASSTAAPWLPTALKWMFYIYWIGVAAFALNLLLQIVVLLFQAYTKPFIRDGKYRIVELSGDKAPCSFGNNIFINPEKYDWETYSQILLHEKVHIQQKHSFDILIAELVLVLQWFNPFAWLYRNEVENNLEFLTDDAVLGHNDVERTSYQMSLLKVSAPHLSLGITTNYNQSLLKRRIVMMNAKKSNIHIMWKYFFLVPLLGILACALNNPAAYSQSAKTKPGGVNNHNKDNRDRTQGVWFATLKNERVRMEFKSDDEDRNWSSNTSFPLSAFSNLPKGQKGDFSLKREAGTAFFNGKFEGNEGYGHYKFIADKSFAGFLKTQGIDETDDDDAFTYFIINITRDYVAMLKRNGYGDISKNNLVSMAALKVDEQYIKMWKQNGYDHLSPNELVSGKALGVDAAYVSEIRRAGYTDLSFNQLISFKAQHIDGKYISSIKKAKLKDGSSDGKEEKTLPSANELSSYKAMNIDSSYVRSFAAIGYKNISYRDLTTLKSLNITPEYVKTFKQMGYDNLPVNNLITLKSLNITPEYIKEFQAIGYKDLTVNKLSTLKSLGITPQYVKDCQAMGFKDITINNMATMKSMGIDAAYIKTFEAMGYKDLSIGNLSTLKSLDITPAYIRSFEDLGYKNLSVGNLSTLKSMGIDEQYIKSFEAIGYKNISVGNLSSLKSLGVTPDFAKGFKDLGFDNVSIGELSSCKATGVTPAYVTEMRGKGFKSDNLNKYVQLKTAFN